VTALRRGCQHRENAGLGREMPLEKQHQLPALILSHFSVHATWWAFQ
jgi:hypothetical protein